MSDIPRQLAEQVIDRASNHCEYCQLSQTGQEATFHIDHVFPRALGGRTVLENLALSCVSCSLRKWAKISSIDPATGREEPLFNPRTQNWSEHFRWAGDEVVALTPIGNSTIAALSMNRSVIRAIRIEEAERGRHPPNLLPTNNQPDERRN